LPNPEKQGHLLAPTWCSQGGPFDFDRPTMPERVQDCAAAAILAKVSAMCSEKSQLEARVLDLESELRRCAQRSEPSGAGTLPPRLVDQKSSEAERLELRLRDHGVRLPRRQDTSEERMSPCWKRRGKTLEELQRELDLNVSLLKFEDGKAVRYVDVVRINLLVEHQGTKYCLSERTRFDVSSGRRHNLQLPLQKKMRIGHDWRDETRNALRCVVCLEDAWQDAYLQIDESSYKRYQADPAVCHFCSEFPGLQTVGHVHEVSVHISSLDALPKDEGQREVLKAIGLPSCCDFVTDEITADGLIRLHAWHWRTCEQERLEEIAGFEHYLAQHGVDVALFGTGSMKSLGQLYAEVHENQESSLVEHTKEGGGGEGMELIRTLSLLQIKLVVEVYRQKRVLTSNEQYLDDGRRRKVKQFLVHKMRPGESWNDVLPRAFLERLGVPTATQESCFKFDPESQEYEESVKQSQGYPVRTRYKIWTVTVNVSDPKGVGMSELGLPKGNSFISTEGNLGKNNRGRLHIWHWEVMETNEEQSENFMGTGYEELVRELQEAENLVMQTARHAHNVDMGLDAPLEQTLAKIRSCLSKAMKIDQDGADFDLARMFRKSTAFAGQQSGILADFISSNFTRATRALGGEKGDVKVLAESHTGSLEVLADRDTGSLELHASDLQSMVPDAAMMPALQAIRQNMESFGLCMLDIHEQSGHSVLPLYGLAALGPLCSSVLKCGIDACARFLHRIDSYYYTNPYHNAIHAAQVCHGGSWLAHNLGLAEHQRALERGAFVLAALCHDLKHFGRNNSFCISTNHALSLVYNDAKVLENMHAATCFQALKDDEAGGLLERLREQDRQPLRAQIIELILSTDMSEHFQAISKSRIRRETHDFSMESEADRRFLAQMCLKGGDIGHSALPWDSHVRWSQRISEEFFSQGDEERKLGLPISALCDRNTVGHLGKSQRGFIEFVCMPLFEELACFWNHRGPDKAAVSAGGEAEAEAGAEAAHEKRTTGGRSAAEAVQPKATPPWRKENLVQVHIVSQLRANALRWNEDADAVAQLVRKLRSDDDAEPPEVCLNIAPAPL